MGTPITRYSPSGTYKIARRAYPVVNPSKFRWRFTYAGVSRIIHVLLGEHVYDFY